MFEIYLHLISSKQSVDIEKYENWVTEHCPKWKYLRKTLNIMKGKHVARYLMHPNDIEAVESGRKSQETVLNKYIKKWPKHVKRFNSQIDAYLKRCQENFIVINNVNRADIIFCHFAYGFMPDEYFMYQLIDKTSGERRSYISDRDRLALVYKVNDIIDMNIVRNKNITYNVLGRYYHRDAVSIKKDSDFNDFQSFIKLHPTFVQKNVRKNCGQGVKLVDFSKCDCSCWEYFKILRNDDEYILEERVIQSFLMSHLNASSVNTVRCITLVTENNVIIEDCFLKVGRNHSFLDNGAAGGLLVGIDKSNGKLSTDGYTEFLEIFDHHPDSEVYFKGYQLPDWNALCSLAKELALTLPAVRFVGWDMAHTDDGWILIEGNGRSQVVGTQLLHKKGIKKNYLNELNIDLNN